MKFVFLFMLLFFNTKKLYSSNDIKSYKKFKDGYYNYNNLNIKKLSCELDGFALSFNIDRIKKKLDKLKVKYNENRDLPSFFLDSSGGIKFQEYKLEVSDFKNVEGKELILSDLNSVKESLTKINEIVGNTLEELVLEEFKKLTSIKKTNSKPIEFRIVDEGLIRDIKVNGNSVVETIEADGTVIKMTKIFTKDEGNKKFIFEKVNIDITNPLGEINISSDVSYQSVKTIKVPKKVIYDYKENINKQFSMHSGTVLFKNCFVEFL